MVIERWIDASDCTACGSCMNICPHDAIDLKEDSRGFYKVEISEACTSCKKCVKSCPVTNKYNQNNAPILFAAKSNNQSIRLDSTSGGIFTELAMEVLSNNGIVFGAAYADDNSVEHISISSVEEISKLRQSKYVQSYIGYSFRKIKQFLLKKRTVLFVGTPCQIAGLKQYLQKEYDNLILVDFICRGSNSTLVYRKWLSELETKYNSKVIRVWFKNKEKGWNNFSTRVDFANGQRYLEDRNHDQYIQGYIRHNLYIRDCCSKCRFKGITTRMSDLTLGDFWGVDKNLDDDLGTSVVLINSKKGERLFEAIKNNVTFAERSIDEMIRGNPMINESIVINPKSSLFFDLLNTHKFSDAFEKCVNGISDAPSRYKYDIGLVIHSSRNYGNNLTNYSLYRYLKDRGYKVLLIPRDYFHSLFETKVFGDVNNQKLGELNKLCRMFILGSDQTFARWCVGNDYFTCLPWVNSDKYIASYGSSFGSNDIDMEPEFFNKFRLYLSRFKYISLREQSSVQMLMEKFGLVSYFVLDPVFLTPAAGYRKIENTSRLGKRKFIGAYILDGSPEKMELIKKVMRAEKINSNYVIFDADRKQSTEYDGISILTNATVEEFLGLIDNSEIFITDSFHGVCFSIIFNTPFYVANVSKGRGLARIEAVLQMFGIEDRWVQNGVVNAKPLDFNKINRILSEKLGASCNFLNNVVNDGLHNNCKNPDYLFEYCMLLEQKIIQLERMGEYTNSLLSSLAMNTKSTINCLLDAKTIVEYIQAIPYECVVLSSVCGSASKSWMKVKSYYNTDLSFRESYCSIKHNNETLSNHNVETEVEVSTIINNQNYLVKSRKYFSDYDNGYSLFIVGGKTITLKKYGLNLVVVSRDGVILDVVNVPLNTDKTIINRITNW